MAIEAVELKKFGPRRWVWRVDFDGTTMTRKILIPEVHEESSNRVFMEKEIATFIINYRLRRAEAQAVVAEQTNWQTFTSESAEAQTVLGSLQAALD